MKKIFTIIRKWEPSIENIKLEDIPEVWYPERKYEFPEFKKYYDLIYVKISFTDFLINEGGLPYLIRSILDKIQDYITKHYTRWNDTIEISKAYLPDYKILTGLTIIPKDFKRKTNEVIESQSS